MRDGTYSKVNNVMTTVMCILILLTFGIMIFGGLSNGHVRNIVGKNHFVLDDGWELTFEDNFDFFDHSKWQTKTPRYGVNRAGYYSNDSDTYFVQNGNLVIRTMWRDSGQGEYGAGFYTGRLETASNYHNDNSFGQTEGSYLPFAQKYGYYEIRCKVPPAQGVWASFNLLPDEGVAFTPSDIQGTGTDGAEINVFESAYYKQILDRNVVSHGVTVDGYDSDRAKTLQSSPFRIRSNIYKEFHTYALEWTEIEYIFYIDGVETFRTSHYNGVSQVQQFIRLSAEVGGDNDGNGHVTGHMSWAGDASMNNYKNKAYDYVIDYVRVYSKV